MTDQETLAELLGDKGYVSLILARKQPCGCITCVCEDEERCHGCDAKSCGTHPFGYIPNAVYINGDPKPPDELIEIAEGRWTSDGKSAVLNEWLSKDSWCAWLKPNGLVFTKAYGESRLAARMGCAIEALEKLKEKKEGG